MNQPEVHIPLEAMSPSTRKAINALLAAERAWIEACIALALAERSLGQARAAFRASIATSAATEEVSP